MTPDKARAALMALEDVEAKPHFDRTAYRTPRKIFATMAGDGADVNFMFNTDLQAHYCEMAPDAFGPVPGGWGRSGSTRCVLAAVDAATVASAAKAAYGLAAPISKPTKAPAKASPQTSAKPSIKPGTSRKKPRN